MRHGVVRGIEVIKPAPVFIRDEMRRKRVQQLEVMFHRNRHARTARASLSILQRRKDEHIAKSIQQSTDDIAVRAQVARREDFFFEDAVWREETHLLNVDGNGHSIFGGIFFLQRHGHDLAGHDGTHEVAVLEGKFVLGFFKLFLSEVNQRGLLGTQAVGVGHLPEINFRQIAEISLVGQVKGGAGKGGGFFYDAFGFEFDNLFRLYLHGLVKEPVDDAGAATIKTEANAVGLVVEVLAFVHLQDIAGLMAFGDNPYTRRKRPPICRQ